MSRGDTAEDIIASLTRDGFRHIDEGPRTPGLKVGARVSNRGEQYHRAYTEGTATVVAVMRRGTDERPDAWEQSWGRPNVEVVVQRDQRLVDRGDAEFTCWADYGTNLADIQNPEGQGA